MTKTFLKVEIQSKIRFIDQNVEANTKPKTAIKGDRQTGKYYVMNLDYCMPITITYAT